VTGTATGAAATKSLKSAANAGGAVCAAGEAENGSHVSSPVTGAAGAAEKLAHPAAQAAAGCAANAASCVGAGLFGAPLNAAHPSDSVEAEKKSAGFGF